MGAYGDWIEVESRRYEGRREEGAGRKEARRGVGLPLITVLPNLFS